MLFRTLPAEEKGGASYDLCTWLCTWRVEESGVRARVLVQCGVHDRKKHGVLKTGQAARPVVLETCAMFLHKGQCQPVALPFKNCF